MKKTVCELFAGVGGFRLGLEKASDEWETVWFSQWEPGKKKQWAHDCYVSHWGDIDENTGKDISDVDKEQIPDHNLLVGGFPCQDFSIAQSLSTSRGIEGKKGVLWWQIRDVLKVKSPAFGLFENVDRLLKSPASQRGRDFGIILACLADLGYSVEWRVINAAEYGAAQRRRRTFIFVYKNGTKYGAKQSELDVKSIIEDNGFFAKSFPISQIDQISSCEINYQDIKDVSAHFEFSFENAGYMHNGHVYTAKANPIVEQPILLGDIIEESVDARYYIEPEKIGKWRYLKGAKKINRTSKSGHKYVFSEGPVIFPDPLDRPARTMLTSEGTRNRSSHAVLDPQRGEIRRITPLEAERIQGFDDNWTEGMPERHRYYCMGNALVVSMITRMGEELGRIFDCE